MAGAAPQSTRRVRLPVRVVIGVRLLGGLLADPEARVAPCDARAFGEREKSWIPDWAAFAGDGALDEQVRFEREWGAVRSYAASRGVRIIGDVPIYVAVHGCDHAAHPELFLPLDDVVAGAPPDDLNDLGQLWGNPLYDWERWLATGYRWWIDRMRRVLALVDVFRIDHFRGFAGYWTVPAGAETRTGRLVVAGARAPRSSAPRRPSSASSR